MGLARRVTVIALAAGVAALGCTGDPCEEDAIGCEDDGAAPREDEKRAEGERRDAITKADVREAALEEQVRHERAAREALEHAVAETKSVLSAAQEHHAVHRLRADQERLPVHPMRTTSSARCSSRADSGH